MHHASVPTLPENSTPACPLFPPIAPHPPPNFSTSRTSHFNTMSLMYPTVSPNNFPVNLSVSIGSPEMFQYIPCSRDTHQWKVCSQRGVCRARTGAFCLSGAVQTSCARSSCGLRCEGQNTLTQGAKLHQLHSFHLLFPLPSHRPPAMQGTATPAPGRRAQLTPLVDPQPPSSDPRRGALPNSMFAFCANTAPTHHMGSSGSTMADGQLAFADGSCVPDGTAVVRR